MAITGSGAGAPFELFVVTQGGTLERFDGTAWTQLWHGPGDPVDSNVGVAWVGPGEAIAAGIQASSVVHYKAGKVAEDSLGISTSLDAPISALRVEGLGVLVGTEYGEVYGYVAGKWSQLAPAPVTPFPAKLLVPLSNGLLYGGRGGLLSEWRSGFVAPCPSVAYSEYTLQSAAALGPDILLTSGDANGVVLIRLVPPAPACMTP
jgi:hypothetical protein